VASGKVLDNNLQSIDVKDATLTGADIASNTLTSLDLANGAVTPAKVGSIPAARATISGQGSQSIPSGGVGFTALAFDDEDFDSGRPLGLHSPSVNNTRLTAPISGIYQVEAGVSWDSNGTGTRDLTLRVNGSACCLARSIVPAAVGNITIQNVSDMLNLSSGDFVEALVRQDSGGNLGAGSQSIGSQFLAMGWVGPE
jgi:hypothetical protein